MKRPRRRERPAHSWDRLNGTRLEVLPLNTGTVRRVCVNVDDPLPAVVSFGVHALTAAHEPDRPTMRLVCVDNFNNDPRELHQIPEAREWFRRLWNEGKPLLRLLSECAGDMPADDRLGLTERAVSQLGLGWFDIYVFGLANIDATLTTHTDGGPWYGLAADTEKTREEIRAELLQRSPENPEGYTFDDAANRQIFTRNNIELAAGVLERATMPDPVVLALSLLDPLAAKLARDLHDGPALEHTMAEARRRDLHPALVFSAPRELVAELVDTFAPEAAAKLRQPHPEPGKNYAVFVAFGGTTLAALPRKVVEGTP
jgi:hypothetical protein